MKISRTYLKSFFLSIITLIQSSYSWALINLNSATFNDLNSVGLTYEQIENLQYHRKKCGDLFSIYELQVIPGFDRETIEKILPFVYVEEFWPEDDIIIFVNNKKYVKRKKYWRLLFRYGRVAEVSKGYLAGNYVGSPDDFFTRINFTHPQGYRLSFAYKKKYAELFYPGHIGGYLLLERKFIFDKLVLGDYQIGCGQSLILNSSFSLYKILTNPDLAKHNIKVKQNSSCSKYNFRGLASSIKFFDDFELVLFYSYRFLNSIIQNNFAKITYFDHYKTLNDLKNKDALGEQTLGNILSWKKENSELGFNFVYTSFDHKIKNKSRNHFQGKQNYIGSVFGETLLFDRINIFGECTYLQTFSFIVGSIVTFLKNFSSSLLIRNYSPYLHNFYGNPLHENNEQKNEFGICNVNDFKTKNLNITLSWDYFFFPHPTYRISTSQYGFEKNLKILYNFNRNDFILLRLKNKNKKINFKKELSNFSTVQISGGKKVGNLSFVSQLVYRFDHRKKDQGLGFLETIKYKFQNFDVNIFGGVTFTKGMKIYLREPMMKFCGIKSRMFDIPMIFCGGILGYKLKNNFQIEVLYNFSYAYKDEKIGSGYDEIKGKFRNFFQMQVIYDL